MLYGIETVPMTGSHSKKLEVTYTKTCRWARGHTHPLIDHVKNNNTRERLKVDSITERCRKARPMWFGQVKRRYQEYVGRKTLELVLTGRIQRGKPTQIWMDRVNRDKRVIGITTYEEHARTGLRRIISTAPTHK